MAPAGPCNYGIHDKEMLAIIHVLQEYRAELEGLQREERFDIFTDTGYRPWNTLSLPLKFPTGELG
jgi:hypothetical protein